MDQKLAFHNSESYHYEFAGFTTFKEVCEKLEKSLPYYRFAKDKVRQSREIFYDVQSGLLADAGIAISMWIENGQQSLNVRKVSDIEELKKLSKKYLFGYCQSDERPGDYSYQMAAMIEGTFKTPFSADLESIIKQTLPFMEVDQTSDKYDIICGTGFRGVMQYEDVLYKDLKSGKKIKKVEITFKFPTEPSEEKTEVLNAIERNVKGLVPLNISRFEYAKTILYPKPRALNETDSTTDSQEGDEEK